MAPYMNVMEAADAYLCHLKRFNVGINAQTVHMERIQNFRKRVAHPTSLPEAG